MTQTPKEKSFFLETYGCQMNVAESISLIERLTGAGWRQEHSAEAADLVILNTCAVRKSAENRIWGRLGYYGRLKNEYNFDIAVMGCMSERLKASMRDRRPFIDHIVGVPDRNRFIESLCRSDSSEGPEDEFSFDRVYGSPRDFKAFVPIMHGCNNFCTYCIVPYVRGREVSRPPEDILQELSYLREGNVVEVTLLGQNVNSYRFEAEGRTILFPDLLEMILAQTPVPWIRFMSSHPKDLSDHLIEVIRDNPAMCRHIHLPVQHGSDTILSAMNRQYTRMQYLELVDRIQTAIPGIALSTDILIGFPGETENDVQDTLDLLEQVRFEDAFTYFYNPREGTAAASFPDQLSLETKKARLKEVIKLQRHITLATRKEQVGTEAEVLVESPSKKSNSQVLGRTSRNEMIICSGSENLAGTLRRARVTGLSGTTLQGEWLS